MRLRRKLWVCFLAAAVALLGLIGIYHWLERGHELVETIHHAHNVVLGIKLHVHDSGVFPADLDALVRSGDLPANFRDWFHAGTAITYQRPDATLRVDDPILIVTWRWYRISYTRDFERSVHRDRT